MRWACAFDRVYQVRVVGCVGYRLQAKPQTVQVWVPPFEARKLHRIDECKHTYVYLKNHRFPQNTLETHQYFLHNSWLVPHVPVLAEVKPRFWFPKKHGLLDWCFFFICFIGSLLTFGMDTPLTGLVCVFFWMRPLFLRRTEGFSCKFSPHIIDNH